MVVVRANVVSATASGLLGAPGSAQFPSHSFLQAPGTGMYLGSNNALGFAVNGNAIATMAANGTLTVPRVQANIDASYLDGNIQGEFVIVGGSINCATDLAGTLPQAVIPSRPGNATTRYYAGARSATDGFSYEFPGNIGLQVTNANKADTLEVFVNNTQIAGFTANGMFVNGTITGGFIADANLVTTGTISSNVLPRAIKLDSVQANGAQFQTLQVNGLQSARHDTTSVTAQTVTAGTLTATTVRGTTILGNVQGTVSGIHIGNGAGLFGIPVSNLVGTLPATYLPSTVTFASLTANLLSGNGTGLSGINAANIVGVLDNARLPQNIDVFGLAANAAQFQGLQTQGLQTTTLGAANITTSNLVASSLYTANATVSGNFAGTFTGTLVTPAVAGNGAGLFGLPGSNIVGTLPAQVLPATATFASLTSNVLSGNGAGISGINAANIVGVLDNARLPLVVDVFGLAANAAQFQGLQTQGLQSARIDATLANTGTLVANVASIQFATLANATGSFVGNVFGNVSGTHVGNGAGLFGIPVSNLVGILPATNLPSTVTFASLTSNLLSGNGTGLSGINAANIVGVLDNARLPQNIDVFGLAANGAQFQGVQTRGLQTATLGAANITTSNLVASSLYAANATVSGNFAGTFTGTLATPAVAGNGAGLFGLPGSNIVGTLPAQVLPATATFASLTSNVLSGNGAGISGINAANIVGILDNARLPLVVDVFGLAANAAQFQGLQTQGLQSARIDATLANVGTMLANAASVQFATLTNATGSFVGNVVGNVSGIISGNGAGITNINAANLTGTLENARLPTTVVANVLIANLSGNGIGISGINAANIASGVLSSSRFPATAVFSVTRADTAYANASQALFAQARAGQFTDVQAANVQAQKITALTANLSALASVTVASPSFLFPTGPATGMLANAASANVITFAANGQQVAQFSESSLALGKNAQIFAGGICLNASDTKVNPAQPGFFVSPVRATVGTTPVLTFNAQTAEINYSSSTRRRKTNIIDLGRDTTALYALRPREFDAMDDGTHHVGFIAEEASAVDPVFAWTLDGQIEGIDWFAMLTYVIAEVGKLRAELNELKSL